MALWTSSEAAAATGGAAKGTWSADSVSIDTRTLEPGALFVALKDVRDGHDFVAEALSRGAAAAMVDHVPQGVAPDAPLLVVPDVLAALEALASAARKRSRARIVGVTGSVGKTSTKEMLRVILGGQGRVHAAEKSYNNHWGVPLTMARMPADCDFAVIEIGMNHPGEIGPLARLADLDIAMITTVAAAHLQAFESIEAIATEKAAIFEGLRPGGVAIVNADLTTTPILTAAALAAKAKLITFGEAAEADFHLASVHIGPETTVIRAHILGQEQLLKLSAPGRHFAANALAALAVVDALNLDTAIAAVDLFHWSPPAGRGTRETLALDPVEELTIELIDDAYNANPTSMAAALEVLAATQPRHGVGRVARGRRIAVLGDMLELGPQEKDLHRQLNKLAPMQDLDIVHCVGPLMRVLYEALPIEKRGHWCAEAKDMAARAHSLVDAGDVVMVKGSLGSRVSLVVDAIRKLGHPLADDRERAG